MTPWLAWIYLLWRTSGQLGRANVSVYIVALLVQVSYWVPYELLEIDELWETYILLIPLWLSYPLLLGLGQRSVAST